MPYKVKGKVVYVKKSGRWRKLKAHKTARAARAHLAALRANVRK